MNRSAFERAAVEMADGMARICRLYGVSPLAGRLYAALFLATEPLSLDELAVAVGAAKSSVSVALRKLEGARVARRRPPQNDRRDYYEIVSDPWAVVDDWTRLYFTPELEMMRATTRAVLAALEGRNSANAAALKKRLQTWRAFGEVMATTIDGASAHGETKPAAKRIPIVIPGTP